MSRLGAAMTAISHHANRVLAKRFGQLKRNAHNLADARVFAFWDVERPGRAISVMFGSAL